MMALIAVAHHASQINWSEVTLGFVIGCLLGVVILQASS